MQGKLLINKPGQIPCGLINTSNSNNHQQLQHLNHNHLHHNGLTYTVSANTTQQTNINNNNNNTRLINNNRIDNHKKLDRSISEPVEKIMLQTPINKYINQQNQRNGNCNQRNQQATILTTNASSSASIIMKQNSINSNASNSSSTTSSSRYKTELCRPFEENGTCKYGDKCQFAHGYHELRNLQRHPRYKTVLCRTFHTVGFCPYGPRCHFIHNSEESKKSIITTLQAGGPNSENSESTSSSPTSSLIFDNLSPSTPTSLLLGASAILNGAFVNNSTTGLLNNLQSAAKLNQTITTQTTSMRPKALSIGSCSLNGSSTSGDLSQPSTPPSGSPSSLSSCFDQVDRLPFTPNSYDGSISNNLNNNDNENVSAFNFALNRDALSLCEQEFLSLSLSPLINY